MGSPNAILLESAAIVFHMLGHDLENRQVLASRVFGSRLRFLACPFS